MFEIEQDSFEDKTSLEQKYDHGYSIEEVEKIKEVFKILSKKVSEGYEVSLEEFKTIIIPHIRIHRTEEFILNEKPEKVKKEKIIKEKIEKIPKERKKKEIKIKPEWGEEKLQEIALKMALGENLTKEEIEFFNKTVKGK